MSVSSPGRGSNVRTRQSQHAVRTLRRRATGGRGSGGPRARLEGQVMAKRAAPLPLPAAVERTLDLALDKAMSVQRPVILGYLYRLRGKHNITPEQLLRLLERRYLAAV